METVKEAIAEKAKLSDFEEMTKKLDTFVSQDDFKYLEGICKTMVTPEHICQINNRLDAVEKRQALYLKKDEFMVRIDHFQNEFK